MTTAPRTLIVSPQKNGTHMIQELMLALGYKVIGATRPTPENTPRFDSATRWQIAELVYGPDDLAELSTLDEKGDEFRQRTDDAWTALLWTWYRRFGQPVVNRYGQDRSDFVDRVVSNPYIARTRFAQTPAGLCWIWHDLDITKVDGAFFGEWADHDDPPMILNYRDPRDALVSLINFVEGRTAQGYGNFYERRIFNRILLDKPTMAEKIDYALRDPYFLARTEYDKALWLLHHPAVCKVRFEDLIGPRGGGSEARQAEAVTRILAHIGAQDADARAAAKAIFNPGSWSFHKGQIGGWREIFSPRNIDMFDDLYGDVLDQFGYERVRSGRRA